MVLLISFEINNCSIFVHCINVPLYWGLNSSVKITFAVLMSF